MTLYDPHHVNLQRNPIYDVYQQLQHPNYLQYLQSSSSGERNNRALADPPGIHRRPPVSVHNGCPSCEGTLGSSPSSGSSYLREYCAAALPKQSFQKTCVYHNYQQYSKQTYHHKHCCYRYMEKGLVFHCSNSRHRVHRCSFPKCVSSYNHRKLCYQNHRKGFHDYSRNKVCPHQCPRCRLSARAWESDSESSAPESGKNVSIKAVYGSCSSTDSSQGNPSVDSLEQVVCRLCNPLDSNHSTYGSSDQRDMTDSSSYDSNVFAPADQTGANAFPCSSELVHLERGNSLTFQGKPILETLTTTQCFNFNPEWENENMCSCTSSNNEGDDHSNDSDSTLNLSEVGVGAYSSLASSFNTIDGTPQLYDCDSPDLSLSEISGISTYISNENLDNSQTSHEPLLPKTVSCEQLSSCAASQITRISLNYMRLQNAFNCPAETSAGVHADNCDQVVNPNYTNVTEAGGSLSSMNQFQNCSQDSLPKQSVVIYSEPGGKHKIQCRSV